MNKQTTRKQLIIAIVICLLVGIVLGAFVGKSLLSDRDKDNKKETKQEESEDVLECIELPDYNKMEISIAVTQEDIDAEIESLKEEYTTYEQKKGKVKDGDLIYADIEGYIGGKRIDDICLSDNVQMGSEEWPEDFYKPIVGVKTGHNVKFKINIPDGWYNDAALDGKEAEFDVNVRYICGEEIVPEYNDDFVQSISSDCDTTKEYNDFLKNKLLKENRDDKGTFAWNEILDGCHVVKYPEKLTKQAEDEVLQGYYDMAEISGVSVDEIFQSFAGYDDEKSFKESSDWKQLVQDTVKEYLLAEALAKSEGISYTDADYSNLVEEEYYYNTDKYDSQDKYEEACHDYLERTALHNAVVKWLADNMKYTE